MATSIVTCAHCGTKNRLRPQADGVPRCGNCHNPLPWLVDADESSFDEEVRASLPVLVDFWAEWCGPCRMVSPVVEKVGRENAGKLKVVKLDVDGASEIAGRYGVQGIPLLVLIVDGEEADRMVGAVPEPRLRQWLEPYLGAAQPA